MTRSFLTDGVSPTREALLGLTLAGGDDVAVSYDPTFAYGTTRDPLRKVALLSGGGAGHEPMHASFIGSGGLDAACPGEVFTSPHNRQIYAASKQAALDGGVLHIVKNYTGDRINFAIAAERLRADGIAVDEVLVDDDLGSDGHAIGRRGTAATVIVEKVLGAAADTGMGLAELAELGRRVVAGSRSLSVSNQAHTSVSNGELAFEVSSGNLEYGVGIHGETAAESIAQPDLATLVGRMVDELVGSLPHAPESCLLFVNGLGAVSNLELLHVLAASHRELAARGATVRSAHAGTYVSALDMRGFSITLTHAEDDWLPFWFAPHHTAGLPRPSATAEASFGTEPRGTDAHDHGDGAGSAWIDSLADLFEDKRPALNALDQIAGDGDIGTNIVAGMTAAARRARTETPETLAGELRVIADSFLDDVGGSSGPLFGLVFAELAQAASDGVAPVEAVPGGLRAGLDAVRRVGGAQPGDRTLVDALHPAGHVDEAPREAFDAAAVEAAIRGAAATSELTARRGRASYLADRVLGSPDPGAVVVAFVLTALHERVTPGDARESWDSLEALLA